MAFTGAQKVKILQYLGWPGNTINPDALSYSKIISDRLLFVLPDVETVVADLLTKLAAVETSQSTALDSTGVKKIDDIEFFGNADGTKLQALQKEKNRLIRELASLLDIAFGPGFSGGVPSMGNVCT